MSEYVEYFKKVFQNFGPFHLKIRMNLAYFSEEFMACYTHKNWPIRHLWGSA